jgi:hypothetical protein
MLKFTKTICAAMLLSIVAWMSIARSEPDYAITAPSGSYSGGGYRITIDSRSGDYTGFDRQGHKLVIHSPSYPADLTAQYTNKGYTYRIIGIGQPGDYADDFRKVRLTVANPQGRVILDRILNKVK